MADIPDSWEKYGFPNPTLWTPYKPFAGLIKASDERRQVVSGSKYVIPDFFSTIVNEKDRLMELPQVVRRILGYFDYFIRDMAPYFVNPDKIPAAVKASDCFWTWDDLLLAGADGIEDNIICWIEDYSLSSFVPLWPVKWAIQRYNQINLLRYVLTHFLSEWPYVEYKDMNSTFAFKSPEP